jgi:hypothetical protein
LLIVAIPNPSVNPGHASFISAALALKYAHRPHIRKKGQRYGPVWVSMFIPMITIDPQQWICFATLRWLAVVGSQATADSPEVRPPARLASTLRSCRRSLSRLRRDRRWNRSCGSLDLGKERRGYIKKTKVNSVNYMQLLDDLLLDCPRL